MRREIKITATIVLGFVSVAGFAKDAVEGVKLSADSSDNEIMQHLYQHELNQTQTGALAELFPDMTRQRAYAIQRTRLDTHAESDQHVGWKLGWTRKTGPDDVLDPIMGHYMSGRVYEEGDAVSTRYFTSGAAAAEPEIVFYLKKDLPGPVVTREQVLDAIDNVGIAMEFVNWRVTEPRTREHAIADNGIAAGVVLGKDRFELAKLDFTAIYGDVTVNGKESSSGSTTTIMGEDPLAGLLWAANELPKWGMHLQAGQFVVSGTVCVPLEVKAGDSAEIGFTGMGSIEASFVP